MLHRATTHTDIVLRARSLNIPTRIIHNASIMNAVGACGLQLYNFGQTVSLVFFTETWKPDSFYDRVKENADLGMHTLVLLDIKVKEQSEENLARSVTHLLPSHLHCKAHLYRDQGEKNIRAAAVHVHHPSRLAARRGSSRPADRRASPPCP